MKIDEASSERLSVLRFPLIVGVIFIHAYGTEVGFSNGVVGLKSAGYLLDFCRNLISQGLARVAVPLFFLMSGYFFFMGLSFSFEGYKEKIRSRFRTLLIPFLFWNVVTICLVALAQFLPSTQGFFSGKNSLVSTFGVFDFFNAIFGFDRHPIAYQFWFIRDLMVMALVAPMVFLLLNLAPKTVLFLLFALWFLSAWPIYIPSVTAFAFFYAGAYFARSGSGLFAMDQFGPMGLLLYLAVLLVDVLTKDHLFNVYINNFGILLGIGSALYVTSAVVKVECLKKILLWAGGCSFFVFAVHEPLLTVMRKLGYKLLQPSSDMSVLFLYFTIPIFVIFCSLFSYVCLKFIAPRFLSVISGGRH